MCEQTEINYLDGEVVWVKLGSCWWPGEVVAKEKLPPDVLSSFRKPPIACVKFFQENAYEYVKNAANIYKYNCSRKTEFINKGLYLFRTKHGHMEKFPDDIVRAETAIGGDKQILTRDEFQETKKESYAGLFGTPKKTPIALKKVKSGKGRLNESPNNTPHRQMKEKTDYRVHILVQGSKQPVNSSLSEVTPTPSTSINDATPDDAPHSETANETEANHSEDNKEEENNEIPQPSLSIPSTPLRSAPPISVPSSSGIYSCHACPFTTTRLNVLILHNKTHSVSFMPYTPSPIRKKTVVKSTTKSTPISSKTPKPRKPRKEKVEKTVKKLQAKKRPSAEISSELDEKKPKTDEEIKSSLLADWDDDVDEDSNDESSTMVSAQSPEVPVGAESPAVPTPAELPTAQLPAETSPVPDKKSNSSLSTEKPESSSDSKYEFCEDEDWPEEADIGRKIPRVKNPIRTEDPKSVGIDDDDVAREVAELLNSTAVPELPSVPEPLRIEENFPEPSIVKSPDKNQDKSPEIATEKNTTDVPPTKAIFKTKTFFRSRHSRSQDAIGKYVAEQLNAVERMDISESDINGSEAVSSPEARDSPPIEQVKVARLAPKIQLKKMKAEAAQLREKEKLEIEQAYESHTISQLADIPDVMKELPALEKQDKVEVNEISEFPENKHVQDVLYPTQEIKPLNEEMIPKRDTGILTEPFTEKDFYVETENNEVSKDANNINHEEELAQNVDNQAATVVKTFIEDSPKFEEETVQFQKETNLEEDTTDFGTERDVLLEQRLQNSELKNKTNELKKESPDFREEVDTPVLENETSKLVTEPVCHGESPKYEVHTTVDNDNNLSKQLVEGNDLHQELNVNQESEETPVTQLPELSIAEKEEQPPIVLNKSVSKEKPQEKTELYMNESTASAVDALLSVSRETDRVPRVVSNDLPEDLFEDDKEIESIEPISENNIKFVENIYAQNSTHTENGLVDEMETEEIPECVATSEIQEDASNNLTENITAQILNENMSESAAEVDVSSKPLDQDDINVESVVDNVPSESDLQVAEALINLPATAIRSKTPTEHKDSLMLPFVLDHENNQEEIVPVSENVVNDTEIGFQENEVVTETVEHPEANIDNLTESDNLNARFETEQEKSENLNAAQSLVQMSECIEHKMNIIEQMDPKEGTDVDSLNSKPNNGIDISANSIEQNLALLSNNGIEKVKPKPSIMDQSSSKLLKILEEPCKPKLSINKALPSKQIVQGKEKILNFDVAKSVFKNKSPKQKIIIRRNPTTNKTVLNRVSEVTGADKIILSRSSNPAHEGSSVQTFTIQTSPDAPSDANTIIIQQKIRKIAKPAVIQPKLQKIKPQTPIAAPAAEVKTIVKSQSNDDAMFDINSMPIVLSEDLLTAESIEKMPVVMTDGNIIGQPQSATKIIKQKQNVVEHDKVVIGSSPHKPEVKTLLLNPAVEVTKSATPNILSKSSKLRGAKPMLVIDKATGKQKIIMTKSEPVVKEMKQPQPSILQAASPAPPKTEKFIILPTQSSAPRPARTQKIVIDPQTGKAHMFVAKGEGPLNATENKPLAAKLLASQPDAAPGGTVMIITNAQGAQSRMILTPRHEKILFPNKQQPGVPQLKTISHRITSSSPGQKGVVTSIAPAKTPAAALAKAPARIVPKQNKSAIITSKGQLIVGGRITTTAQNIAPLPELRPVQPKRILPDTKKLTQTAQKSNSEPIIFLQQKSGAVMQLTAAQFEHLQRTGQIVQKTPAPVAEKIIIQKAKPAAEPGPSVKRARKLAAASPTPMKKLKHEVAIAPAPAALAPAPPPLVPAPAPAPAPVAGYSDYDNFEELLPSTAIARAQAAAEPAPAPVAEPASALAEQLLAVPGEHFGALAGTFYLCVEKNGGFTPIDNRPLVLENDQLVPVEPTPPERRDILEAALANSDVFHADAAPADAALDFRDLNANVSVHCRVSETSTTLHQPIMTPVELPSGGERAVPASLEAGLAVIGVAPPAVPTSLELPITVTDPRIAPPAADPLAAISMPLLTDDDAGGGKSMPILEEAGDGWPRRRAPPADLDHS